MPTKIAETIRDGLLVTSAVTTAGIYTASQYRLLQALAGLHQALTPEEYTKLLGTPVPDRSTSGIAEITREIGRQKSKRKFQQLSFRFEPFLQSIQRFFGVINTLVSAKPEVAALIWGSVKFVITVALDYFDYFEKLSKLFEKLGDLCPLFDQFEEVFPKSGRLRESLADFYAISINFYTEALKFLRKPSFGQVMKSLWKPYNISFQDLESELQRQREIVSNEIQLASEIAAHQARLEASLYQGAGNQHRLATASYQDEGRQHRREMTLYQNETRQHYSNQITRLANVEDLSLQNYVAEKERKHKVLLEAISSYDHRCTFSNIRSKRHKGTGLWLFDVSEFKKWDQGQKSCGLWCHGIPGAGKSILTAGIIDHLFSRQQAASLQQDTRVSICYFFCDFATTESLKVQTILRSLIKQILSVFQKTSVEVGKDLEGVFLKGHREPDTEELNRVFLLVTQLPATTYLIIDGLDECKLDDRGQFLSSMKKLIESSKGRVKILISSRAKIDITRCLKDFYQIPLDSAKNHSDISIFVRETIDEKLNNNVFEVGDPSMREEIKEALIRGSDGMFLWVTFQIDDICKENTDHGIRQVLRSLPKGLNETYSRILRRITTNHKPDVAKKIFIWLAIARRPLSLDELSEAVAFEPGCLRWDQGNFQNSPLNMLRNCGNLVIHEQDNRSVRFAHYTILEFLVSRVTEYSTEGFLIQKQKANLYVGKVCLTYLSFPDFKIQISRVQKDTSIPVVAETWVKSMQHHNPGMKILSKVHPKRPLGNSGTSKVNARTLQGTENTSSQPLEVLGKQFSLLDYIAKNWIYHCTELPQDDIKYWTFFENLLFRQKLPFEHLLWAFPNKTSDSDSIFWLAVEMDHLSLLGAACSLLNAEDIPISTCIEKRNTKGQTVLQLASMRGKILVIQGLIDLGANVNAEPVSDGGRTALQAAAEGGHLDVVNRLLEAKADVNAKPARYYGRTALQAAAGGGHLDVVNRLLEAKADVNANPAAHEGRTALQAAAGGGHLDVVNRLLEAKADVNANPARYYSRTALQAAAGGGHLDVVNRLLEAKADVNANPAAHEGRTALQAAAGGGHLDVVNRLLEAKADVNAGSADHGPTALQAAAGGGHLDVVNRLLEAKADVNANPARYYSRTALQAAAGGGHLDVVNRLLEAKADVNANPAAHEGRTALQAAAGGGHLDVVNRLLEAKADVNAGSADHGPTALQAAAGGGHLDVVNRLLEAKADVNANPARYYSRTALQAAAGGGHLDVVNRLLEAKADVNAGSALQAAAGGGHLDVVNRLLEAKADVNAGSELQAAAGGGHLDVVNRLLEAKADVNANPARYYGRTALQAAAEGGHLDFVNRLLEAKADVNANPAAHEGRTALQAAAGGGHLDVVNRLLEAKADVNADSALQAAAGGGHLDVVNRLLEAKADVNADSALQAAAGGGHLDVVNRLLEAKADVNADSALQAAAGGGHLDVVNRLLEAKADVNANSADHGPTALQAAAGGGHLDVVNRLLEAKADVNANSARYYSRTALQAAAGGGHLDVVNRLLEAKADVNAGSALQAAAGGGHLDVVNRLLEAKADVNAGSALQAAAGGGHLDVVNRLLEAKADVNVDSADHGPTALQAAAGGGHLDVVNRLLEAKADVNVDSADHGPTALQAAAGGGHLDVVNRLLEAKADVNANPARYYGRTALQAAAGGGHLDFVNRLLEAKADVNANPAARGGRTALQAAAGGGHLDVVNRLLEAKADVNANPAARGGRTALQAAAGGGHLDVVERLRNAGAK